MASRWKSWRRSMSIHAVAVSRAHEIESCFPELLTNVGWFSKPFDLQVYGQIDMKDLYRHPHSWVCTTRTPTVRVVNGQQAESYRHSDRGLDLRRGHDGDRSHLRRA